MVELIDLFPTLQDLAGFAVSPELEGISQAALFAPHSAAIAASPPRKVALAQFPRCVAPGSEPPSQYWDHNNCNSNTTDEYTVMGHTMRTADGWRFTRWVKWNQTSREPEWSSQDFGEELYDFRGETLLGDFDMQSDNLVADTAHAELVRQLRRQLEMEFSKKHP
jgi:arylsulfatase A-like enzyme